MVAVDPLMACIPNRNWRYTQSCHMIADTEEELIAFAKKIALRPEWIQRNSIVHFDLNYNKRQRAIAAGAVEITSREFVDIMRARRGVKDGK